MSDAVAPPGETSKRSMKMPLLIGLALAFAGAAGGYFGMTSGLVPLPGGHGKADARQGEDSHHQSAPAGEHGDHGQPELSYADDVAFVEIEPLLISLGGADHPRLLRFRAQLEVPEDDAHSVAKVMPRIIDVLNGYLRALELRDFEQPMSLQKLRGQMLRRIQIVVGPEKVRDLLIMEFVLN